MNDNNNNSNSNSNNEENDKWNTLIDMNNNDMNSKLKGEKSDLNLLLTIGEEKEKDNFDNQEKKDIIGRWYLDKELGHGAFGWVILGINIKNNKSKVALKFICKPNTPSNVAIGENKSDYTSFLNKQINTEIDVYRQLKHKNIIKLLSYDLNTKYKMGIKENNNKVADCVMLVFEYCEWGSINDNIIHKIHNYVNDNDETKIKIFRSYFHQLISALQECHSHDIIHRDLKPDNLLLDSNFQLKIADFGLSNVRDLPQRDNNNAISHERVGTQGFIAPEVALGRNYGSSCDIFSAGVILFYFLFGFC